MRFELRIHIGVKLCGVAVGLALAAILAHRFGRGGDWALLGLGGWASALLLATLALARTGPGSDRVPARRGPVGLSSLRARLDALEARNEELERACRQAETRAQVKTRFLAQMSHEMRTPMNGIIGFADLLAKTPLAEYQLEKLGLIERSAKSLLEIVNEILDLARIEAEQFRLKPEWFPLRPYLEDTVTLISARAKVSIVLCVEPAVPELFHGDPIRLQQVVANLLGNAVKFTHAGRIVVRARRLRRADSSLLFSVSDTGRGIAAEHLDRLFAPFSQVDGYAPNGERGSGLGLNIARAIVERMGGTIGVVSRPGKGSTFWFTHPLEAGTVRAKPGFPGFKLALIDPDPLSRKALRYQLQSVGATGYGFASLEEFDRSYQAGAHGVLVLINAAAKSQPLLLRGIGRVRAAGGRPVLILPHSSRRIREYYRAQNLPCLGYPVRSDALSELLAESPVPPKVAAHLDGMSTLLVGRQFLVVDDNEINRRLLEARLTRLGARVVEAPNGTKALVRLRTRAFDLVFMDLRMPGMSGLELLRELLLGEFSPNHSTPFVAVTAHLDEEERIAIVQAGFADVLLKPVLDGPLLAVLGKYLKIGPVPPARPGAGTEPLADCAAVFLEKTGGDRLLAQSLARKLVKELQEQSQEIQRALRGGDFTKLRESAHRINGSASFCGLGDIRSSADALERAVLQAAHAPSLDLKAQRLDQEINRFLEERDQLFTALDDADAGVPLRLLD